MLRPGRHGVEDIDWLHITEPHVIDPSMLLEHLRRIDRTAVSTGVGARAGLPMQDSFARSGGSCAGNHNNSNSIVFSTRVRSMAYVRSSTPRPRPMSSGHPPHKSPMGRF